MNRPAGETPEHRQAKADIAAACLRAGYTPVIEAIAPGWRADVLAQPPEDSALGRIAFEVQWSGLSLEDCLIRQGRYAADGVRGCWFFRHPPRELMRRASSGESRQRLSARADLPLFQLLGAVNRTFQVALNGQRYGVEAFVYALLTRKIRFCPQAAVDETVLRAALITLDCQHCRHPVSIWQARPLFTARCGVPVEMRDADQAAQFTFHPAVIAAAAEAGHGRANMAAAVGGVFVCPRCGGYSDPEALRMALYGTSVLAQAYAADSFQVSISAEPALRLPFAHWCFPPYDRFCDL